MRQANVVPVYKKGPKHIPGSYRPVYLICMFCKMSKHVVSSQVMWHLEGKNILYRQHDFNWKRSCKTQLLGFLEDHRDLQKGLQTDVIIMNL